MKTEPFSGQNGTSKYTISFRLRQEQNVDVLGRAGVSEDATSNSDPSGTAAKVGGGPLGVFVELGGSSASLSSVISALQTSTFYSCRNRRQ